MILTEKKLTPLTDLTTEKEFFLTSDRLATLTELHFLLFELLKDGESKTYEELAELCKQKSLNFAYAFENTIAFLLQIGVTKSYKSRIEKNIETHAFQYITSEEFSKILIHKTIQFLDSQNKLDSLITKNIYYSDNEQTLFNNATLQQDFPFIGRLLQNCNVALPLPNNPVKLMIIQPWFKALLFEQEIKRKQKAKNKVNRKKPVKILISYASQDENYKNDLVKHLGPLKEKGDIDYWEGRSILPGDKWDSKIREELEQADIFLLLISVDFISSKYIKEVELKRALERFELGEVTIVPILVRPCDFTSLSLNEFQALPVGKIPVSSWEDHEEAYINIIEMIKTIL